MKYGFIGCGNMGGAIARALAKSTRNIILSDVSDKAMLLAQELNCDYGSNTDVASQCDAIFLAVKPNLIETVLAGIQDLLLERKPLLISMAAGVTIDKVEKSADCQLPIIRIMPNTPVAVGMGMIVYCTNALVERPVLEAFLSDMQPAGKLDAIEESMIDAACAVSGCGPAFMYLFADAIAHGAESCGLPKDKALQYAAATMAGAAQMLLTSERKPEELINAVCSPGGSTIAGITNLEQNNFRQITEECIRTSYHRTVELGK